jgi:glycosyltransferase involved in cell wall biosynthesis
VIGPEFVFYAKDFLFTLVFALKIKEKFDVCIAADNLNTFSALFLRKIGFIKKVIFFTIDYTPIRFSNNLLNTLYHLLDRYCCYKCNFIWNTTKAMELERRKKGIDPNKCAPQIVVPNATNFHEIKRFSIDEIDRFTIAFLGHLRENKGPQLIIEAFSAIVKVVPQARLLIIGTGPLEEKLKERVAELGIGNHVEFKGFIDSHEEIEKMLAKCAIGVAPYVEDSESFTYYSDPLKPKVYMATGLPVVITRVPKIAWEIEKNRAGFAINYDLQQLIDAVTKLLTDEFLYVKFRKNAISLASKFTWSEVFSEAFNKSSVNL